MPLSPYQEYVAWEEIPDIEKILRGVPQTVHDRVNENRMGAQDFDEVVTSWEIGQNGAKKFWNADDGA